MTWEEFKKERETSHRYVGYQEYEVTQIECPECGENIFKNMSLVLTSYPPQHQYRCFKCGWVGSA